MTQNATYLGAGIYAVTSCQKQEYFDLRNKIEEEMLDEVEIRNGEYEDLEELYYADDAGLNFNDMPRFRHLLRVKSNDEAYRRLGYSPFSQGWE